MDFVFLFIITQRSVRFALLVNQLSQTTTVSQTNETTNAILNFLFRNGIYSYRQNSTGIPLPGGGFRAAAKTGLPDIVAILPPHGKHIGIEIKTGRDKLRPEQAGTLTNINRMGGVGIVVKDFEDFISQWNKIINN